MDYHGSWYWSCISNDTASFPFFLCISETCFWSNSVLLCCLDLCRRLLLRASWLEPLLNVLVGSGTWLHICHHIHASLRVRYLWILKAADICPDRHLSWGLPLFTEMTVESLWGILFFLIFSPELWTLLPPCKVCIQGIGWHLSY